MKKALFISLCVLLLAGTGCKKNAEPEPHKVIVTSVSVKPSSLSLKVGETAQLTATVTPVNADNDNVNWSSSEFDATYNWHFDFNDGIARRNAKWCTYYVRAFLAF